ncbi:MAG TPA: beta-propeller fold lactonase family protein [Kofleriaceae bacterium]|nr:beta-propeller fold lactonase family protein [Kofleriaceae bacterium]
MAARHIHCHRVGSEDPMRVLCCLGGLIVAAACSSEVAGDYGGSLVDGGASADSGYVGCLSSNECPAGYVCNDFGRCERPPSTDAGVMPPPEVEYDFGAPISSQRYVYVAMTAEDSLARIDGTTLAVRSTKVGESPREVATIPGTDGAVVLDTSNGTATIVRPDGDSDAIRVLGTLQRLNRLDIDPSGRFAVIWFDLAKAIAEGNITNVGSFQDVTVLALAPGAEKAVNLTVGFRPRNVQFDAAGNRAYVVTEDGVSVIDLAYATDHEPSIVPPIPVIDPSVPASDVEVDIVATGEYAAVRQSGASSLRIVNVGSMPGVAFQIPLASPPTDIDLAPDGARLYAVLRSAKQLAIIDVPGDAQNPTGVETVDLTNATLGSLVLSRDGHRGLLYTNATADERITLVKLDQPGYPKQTWTLKKSVRAVGISPTGDTALLLNAKAFGDPSTASNFDDYIDKSYGYTLLDLATGFGKLQITPVDPGPFTYSPDGSKVYVNLDGGDTVNATRAIQVVTTQTGVVITKPLGSPPSSVGMLPGAAQAFVAQRHPLGRVSFLDLTSDAVRTVTGFDLNSQVVQ